MKRNQQPQMRVSDLEAVMTLREAREWLRISRATLYNWIDNGTLRDTRRIGGRRYVPVTEVQRLIDSDKP
jgi:excisionase family DNA binding protein